MSTRTLLAGAVPLSEILGALGTPLHASDYLGPSDAAVEQAAAAVRAAERRTRALRGYAAHLENEREQKRGRHKLHKEA